MISLAEMNTTPLVYASAIQGAGIFDLSGLPKEYFTMPESTDSDWVQTVFQELGLQALLLSVCQLEDFRYARIYGKEHRAIVVRQAGTYIALLLDRAVSEAASPAFVQWLRELDPPRLKAHTQFCFA